MPSRDIQQRDGAGQHIAVQALPGGDVLCGHGAGGAKRELQRGLLLQRGLCGGERQRVRRTCIVQRVELRGVWGRVSCGVVVSCRICAADGVWSGSVLRD